MTTAPWFEMPSPFETEAGRVLMLEPPGARRGVLRAQLLDETYPKPFVIDDGQRRQLHFSLRLIQSVMRLDAPNALDARYTQKMMSFLLFNPHPREVVLIGLGGGSLLKFCHQQLPGCQVTAVEIDPNVIALRDVFLLPPDGPRVHIIHGDGAEYLARGAPTVDAVLVDAFDREGFAPTLANRPFFEAARSRLAPRGQLVINLAGDLTSYGGLMDAALEVFDDQVILFSVPEDGNHIVLAFRDPHFEPRWRWLHKHAKELRGRHGLDFPAFAQKIERSAKLGLARRSRAGLSA